MTACRASAPAASAEDVVALVREHCRPLAAERVALTDALRRVLREPVRAPEDQPAFDRSSVDGYAVRLDEPGSQFRIVDEIRAGNWKPRVLAPGECVRIATGGALPGERLQVVMKEDVEVGDGIVRALRRDAAVNIRFRGEDTRAGAVLVDKGTRLNPGALSLLASLGHTRPLVTRLPRVRHVATGNEIVPPEQTPQRGQIRDSNSTLVRAFLGQWGIEPEQVRTGDDQVDIESAVTRPTTPLAVPDLLLVSGGASVGEQDCTGALFDGLGYRIHLRRTNTRPGKPLIFATHGHTLAFGLPGNPLAHFVCLNLFVRAALDRLAGLDQETVFTAGVLAGELNLDGNSRETLWPARVRVAGGRCELAPLRWSSSGDLTCLATADALLRVPPGCRMLPAGSVVSFVSTTVSR